MPPQGLEVPLQGHGGGAQVSGEAGRDHGVRDKEFIQYFSFVKKTNIVSHSGYSGCMVIKLLATFVS